MRLPNAANECCAVWVVGKRATKSRLLDRDPSLPHVETSLLCSMADHRACIQVKMQTRPPHLLRCPNAMNSATTKKERREDESLVFFFSSLCDRRQQPAHLPCSHPSMHAILQKSYVRIAVGLVHGHTQRVLLPPSSFPSFVFFDRFFLRISEKHEQTMCNNVAGVLHGVHGGISTFQTQLDFMWMLNMAEGCQKELWDSGQEHCANIPLQTSLLKRRDSKKEGERRQLVVVALQALASGTAANGRTYVATMGIA